MPMVYLFFIGCQLVFIPLFNHRDFLSIETLGIIFFAWVSVFNLFAVSIFWSFMTDIWSDEQARRLFPIIALGGTTGAITGPIITSNLVGIIGLASLLAVSVGLLFVAVVCILLLGKWAHQFGIHHCEFGNEAAVGGGVLDGLKQIFSNPFIRSMSLIMLLNDAIGTIAYALITDYSGMAFPNDVIAQTRFAANMDLVTNLTQVIIQITITRWLLINYGVGFVFAIWTCVVVASCLMMAVIQDPYVIVIGSMPFIAVVLIISRALSFGMVQPARETLYTLVPRDLRYKGKNAVDTAVWRAGDILSLLSINGFRILGVTISGFGVIWAALAATSGWIGWRLANRVEKKHLEKTKKTHS